jgi:hypothetical protein
MGIVNHRSAPPDGLGDAAIVVDDLEGFIEAAGRHPRRLVILRAATPPPPMELRRYCLALGGLLRYEEDGEVRTVKNDPSIPDSTAMSLRALPLHTDGTFIARPPERFLLSFAAADEGGGGQSVFMPIARILAAAPDWALEALLRADFLFPLSYDGDLTVSHVGPVLYGGRSALRIRWRSDDIWRPKVVDARGTDAAGAVDWLHEFLGKTEPLGYSARTGETLLIPNTTMLHGRTALSDGSHREVLRAWVSNVQFTARGNGESHG